MSVEPVRISSSIVRKWHTCQRAWFFQYYRDLQSKEGRHPASAVGSFVHTYLEWYYKPGRPEDPQKKMEEHAAEWIELAPELREGVNKSLILSTTIVNNYHQWVTENRMDRDLEWEDTEAHISVDMGEGTGVTLTMKLDGLARRKSTGMPVVVDHKTVQEMGQDEGHGRLNLQFRTYDLGMYLHTGVKHDGVIVNELRRVDSSDENSRPPYNQRWETRWSMDEMRQQWVHLVMVAGHIRKARKQLDNGMDPQQVVLPMPNPQECRRCDYKIPCMMMDDRTLDMEGYIAENYKVEVRV